MQFNAINGLIATHVDEFTVGVMLGHNTFGTGEGGKGRSILIDTTNSGGGAVLFRLNDRTGGPCAAHNVGGLCVLVGAQIHGHRGKLTMAAALSEEDFIFIRDFHDASGLGDGVAKDGAEFW